MCVGSKNVDAGKTSGPLLRVAHMLHPVDLAAVERLLDGDARHRRADLAGATPRD
jgi:hypothetical protein